MNARLNGVKNMALNAYNNVYHYYIMIIPSIWAHIFNGIIIAIILIYSVVNLSLIRRFDTYKILMLLLTLSIAVGIHGLSHLGLELGYGWLPNFRASKFLSHI
jgi:hypothetical protein